LTKISWTSALAVTAGVALAACSSSGGGGGSSSPGASASSGGSSGGTPSISTSDFTRDFSAMAKLKPLVSKGGGSVGVILPDTVTSARYTEFDAPYLSKALQAAGLPSSKFSVQNAQGSDSTEFTDAQEDITKGATVLIMDPLTSGTGAKIESYAKQHGVAVIDYDRISLGGSRAYYVSFNNVQVGKLIGQGLESCVTAWGVKSPQVLVMKGDPTDNNATLFAQGYDGVLAAKFNGGGWKSVGSAAGTWDPPTAETEFQQQYTAHKNLNSVLVPNDENAAPIIHYLQSLNVKPKSFPVTGQDATLVGLQNILSGYQCGTAYKPIYLEAQAAAALAMYLRAGEKPPSSLANGTTTDTQAKTAVPSVLLTPEWVTPATMNKTVIADQFVPAKELCAGSYASDCKANSITP
jgi:D-xylose transport system substrate-binding protein